MKRFTECLKWRDPWFRELSLDGKLVFWYFVDNCDAAGVWEPDYPMVNFCLKRDIEWDKVWTEFGDRVVKLPSGKLWMRKFIEFQYGQELNPKNSAHLGVLRRLELAGISYPPPKGLPSPCQAPVQGAKDKDKDKDNKERGAGGNHVPDKTSDQLLAESIYDLYPKKADRGHALIAIKRALTKKAEAELREAVTAYAGATALWPKDERDFIPNAATWFNGERWSDDRVTWQKDSSTNGRSLSDDTKLQWMLDHPNTRV